MAVLREIAERTVQELETNPSNSMMIIESALGVTLNETLDHLFKILVVHTNEQDNGPVELERIFQGLKEAVGINEYNT